MPLHKHTQLNLQIQTVKTILTKSDYFDKTDYKWLFSARETRISAMLRDFPSHPVPHMLWRMAYWWPHHQSICPFSRWAQHIDIWQAGGHTRLRESLMRVFSHIQSGFKSSKDERQGSHSDWAQKESLASNKKTWYLSLEQHQYKSLFTVLYFTENPHSTNRMK